MNRRMGKKKLTRLILAALMATGGGLCWSPSVEATAGDISGVVQNPETTVEITSTSIDTSLSTISATSNVAGNIAVKVDTGVAHILDGVITTVWNVPIINQFNSTYSEHNIWDYYVHGAGNTFAASNYKVNMTGGKMRNLYGGAGWTQDASKNIVNFSGGTVTQGVYGGYSERGAVTGNEVHLSSGAEMSGASAGGTGFVIGGGSQNGKASKNLVEISGSGTTYGINASITGGGSYTGDAQENEVSISGGTIGGEVIGGSSNGGAATGNIVTISGGTVKGNITGGYGYTEASNNTVTISGDANLAENVMIYGGMAREGAANNNTVNILKAINVLHIMGGDGDATSTGNTLNIGAKGVTVGNEGVAGFQQYNFFLPTDMTTSDTMLTVNGTAVVTDAKVGVMAQGKLTNLTKDDKVTLLHADTLNGTVTQTTEITVPTGLTTVDSYEFSVTSDPNNIYATITKDSSNNDDNNNNNNSSSGGSATADAQKSVVETRAAAVTLLNAGADMLASQGFAQAANAVALEAAEQAKNAEPGVAAPVANAFTPFAAFGGSSMRAESGSHVDTKGFGINVGFAKEFSNSQGKLLFGPVVEYGGGNYDSYNNDVHGDGKSHYWGIGLMARQVNHDGFYYEGSVRGGRVTSDYSANFANNAGGTTRASYDSSSNYWAAHVGLGKVFAAGKKGTVDGYLKYFYSHQAGDDTDIRLATATGEGTRHVSFDSVNSHRVRVGARYTHKVNEMNSLYGGLAYQYEFGGEARAHYGGVGEAPSPSVKGSSGMLELGWQVKPGGPVTIDLGVTGWAGKQRGGSVQLGATWTF